MIFGKHINRYYLKYVWALLFGLLAQSLIRLDGLRGDEVEALLNLNRDGVPIGLRGLLIGGIVISALGAVMDVTMGICSAMQEVHDADPAGGWKKLFRSGMNVGRDMVGTMTNTLREGSDNEYLFSLLGKR